MITVENLFDMTAGSWDNTEEKRFEKIHFKTLRNTKKYLRPNDIVLDFGCATGTKAIELSKYVKTIYALDISSRMIETAKKKAADRKIENVEFVQTTILDERYKSESFDIITAFAVLHLLEDYTETIERITALLKPGGLFISTTPCLNERMDSLSKLKFSLVRLVMGIGLFPAIKKFSFFELEDVITSAKLEIVESEKMYDELSSYFIVAKKI